MHRWVYRWAPLCSLFLTDQPPEWCRIWCIHTPVDASTEAAPSLPSSSSTVPYCSSARRDSVSRMTADLPTPLEPVNSTLCSTCGVWMGGVQRREGKEQFANPFAPSWAWHYFDGREGEAKMQFSFNFLLKMGNEQWLWVLAGLSVPDCICSIMWESKSAHHYTWLDCGMTLASRSNTEYFLIQHCDILEDTHAATRCS